MPARRKHIAPDDLRAAYAVSHSGRNLRIRLGYKGEASNAIVERLCSVITTDHD